MIRLGIDAMGGDFAPIECVKGIRQYAEISSGKQHFVLFGDKEEITKAIDDAGTLSVSYEIVHCTNNIEMSESPTRAIAQKPESSIVQGFKYLCENKIDGFASAGNTGAVLVGAIYTVKNIPGVIRPALVSLIPRSQNKLGLLVDVGANADCKPELLLQFGILGSIYLENIFNVPNPKVALINIGEEEGKGNMLAQAAYPLLKESTQINFIGNIEGRDVFKDHADVMVCDGFTGNIILKMGESFYDVVKSRNISDPFFELFNYENFGGTAILGVNAPVFIGHGISNANAFSNMFKLMNTFIEREIIEKFRHHFIQSTTSIES
ncbi:MAG: phosphate acyltransferase PlsX [Bacteroidota bacterium]|jgi:glycerol-3-phosphate acyltransferase PlsX